MHIILPPSRHTHTQPVRHCFHPSTPAPSFSKVLSKQKKKKTFLLFFSVRSALNAYVGKVIAGVVVHDMMIMVPKWYGGPREAGCYQWEREIKWNIHPEAELQPKQYKPRCVWVRMDGVEKYAERWERRRARHHFRINYLNSICMCVTRRGEYTWERALVRLCWEVVCAFKTDLGFLDKCTWRTPPPHFNGYMFTYIYSVILLKFTLRTEINS